MGRDVLYNHQRWEQVSNENKRLMKMYLRSQITNKRSEKTISQYESDLKFFFTWNLLYNDNLSALNFKKRHFEDFKFFMIDERKSSNARINRLMSAIRTMMGYAEEDDDEYEDYVRNVASKIHSLEKKPEKDIVFVTEQQIVLLREQLRKLKMYKLMFLIDLLYDSGARINEIFQVKDFSTASRGYVKVKCKGGCNEYILLHERALESLKLYSETLTSDNLWISEQGVKIRYSGTLRDWVQDTYDILKELDNTIKRYTPHSFRHSMIENLENGSHYLCEKIGRSFTTEEIAALVHHKSIDMTKSYMKPKDDKMIMNLFGIALN